MVLGALVVASARGYEKCCVEGVQVVAVVVPYHLGNWFRDAEKVD
jgi:hypothetical protein